MIYKNKKRTFCHLSSQLCLFSLSAKEGSREGEEELDEDEYQPALALCQNYVFSAWMCKLRGECWETGLCDKQINQQTLAEQQQIAE